MAFLTILFMSSLLGVVSFSVAILPLSFVFAKSHLAKLSTFGTGLLLGAALGVIIPEGIESISVHHPTSFPTSKIALSLLTGFTFMFIIEQFTSHSSSLIPLDVHFGADLGELEHQDGHELAALSTDAGTQRAYPFTLGLAMHGLADGLALGVSSLSNTEPDLSIVVFLALIIHKAPTALALTTSLSSTTLSRSECKKYIAFFSASTPLGALVSLGIFSFLQGEGDWTGTALLISGSTFLYVATVLQPVSPNSPSEDKEMNKITRALLMVIGIFLPFLVGALLGHGHGQQSAGLF